MFKYLFILSILSAAPSAFAQEEAYSTGGAMGYEADGLDLWDLAAHENVDLAISNFKQKCAEEIPQRIAARFPITGLDKKDFTFHTTVYTVNYQGLGLSYRCYVDVTISDPYQYQFTKWKATGEFFDVVNPRTGRIITTAYDQCKTEVARFDTIVKEMKLFDRHAILDWVKGKDPVTGKPAMVQMCYVTYIQVCDDTSQLSNCE